MLKLFVLIVAAGCVIIAGHPALSSLLVYDRQAVLAGELWRLCTCHLVHFSRSHLVFNLLGFLLAAWIIGQHGYRHFQLLCGLSALAISGAILLWQPGIVFYGGLSGIVNAIIVYAAIHGMREEGRWRWFCLAAVTLCIVNTMWETATGDTTLARAHGRFIPVPFAHLIGGLNGAVMACFDAQGLPTAISRLRIKSRQERVQTRMNPNVELFSSSKLAVQ